VPIVKAFGFTAVIVISDDPLKLTPLILRAVCNVAAVVALPLSAPAKLVDVTEVSPVRVVDVPPRLMLVDPIVTALLTRLALATFDSVLLAPLIVLLVSVSVVARPTKVSVLVGRVKTPVLTIDDMLGDVNVGDVPRTFAPLPVLVVTPVPPFTTASTPDVTADRLLYPTYTKSDPFHATAAVAPFGIVNPVVGPAPTSFTAYPPVVAFITT